MKFFKNAAIYRMTRDAINLDDMDRMLDACRFHRVDRRTWQRLDGFHQWARHSATSWPISQAATFC